MPIQDRPASAPSPQIVGFARAPQFKPLDRFQVFGERRSGTNLLERLIAQNTALTAGRDHGWKHGVPAYPVFPQQCLFLVIVRHPLDWMASLYRAPFEAHRRLTRLPFDQFLPAEWEGLYLPVRTKWDRIGHDVDLAIAKREILQLDRQPLDGRRFRYVAEMRAVKLRGHLSFLARDVNAAVLRYEDLARDQAGSWHCYCRFLICQYPRRRP
ncbi:MAG: hypothetical protein AAF914_10520 [Pseudomonadota bacterium]